MRDDVRTIARLLASKDGRQLFGHSEFQVRDVVHRIGAKAMEIAANERQKRAIMALA